MILKTQEVCHLKSIEETQFGPFFLALNNLQLRMIALLHFHNGFKVLGLLDHLSPPVRNIQACIGDVP